MDDSASPPQLTESAVPFKKAITRAPRACLGCRKVKSKCINLDNPPCQRCTRFGTACEVIPSRRGAVSRSKRDQTVSSSIRRIGETLEAVLRTAAGEPEAGPTNALSYLPNFAAPPSFPAASTSQLLHSAPSLSPKYGDFDFLLNPVTTAMEASSDVTGTPSDDYPLDGGPLELLAKASRERLHDGAVNVGVASERYFDRSGTGKSSSVVAHAEVHSLLNFEQVASLFKLFMTKMNVHSIILNEQYHTLARVAERSDFLLTAICAAASKYLAATAHLQAQLTALTSKLAYRPPGPEWRCIETIQAFLVLAIWGTGPQVRVDCDPLWFNLGTALRLAIDINLHRRTLPEDLAGIVELEEIPQEILNRERTWVLLFSCDRSTSAQLNRPTSLPENYLILGISQWGWSEPGDRRGAAYAELQVISSKFLSTFRPDNSSRPIFDGQNSSIFTGIYKAFEREIAAWYTTWSNHDSYGRMSDQKLNAQQASVDFYYHYNNLLLCAFGLQFALEKSPADIAERYSKCHTSATQVIVLARERLASSMTYSPDAHFLFCSYACVMLLKLSRMHALPLGLEYDVAAVAAVELVDNFATFLASIAVNAQHTPNLYARFLHQLVAQRKQDSTASPDSTAPARTELQYFDEGSIDAGGTLLGRDAFSGYLTPMRYSRAASEDWVASLFQNDAFIFDMPSASLLLEHGADGSWGGQL